MMQSIWLSVFLLIIISSLSQQAPQGPLEREHNPEAFTTAMTPYINKSETKIPGTQFTPDYRVPEPVWTAYNPKFYAEENRPYRISPHWKQAKRWSQSHKWLIELWNPDNPFLLGCYCTTVYKKFNLLAGCAVITTRHILTTATSTYMVLRDRKHWGRLEGTLGAWYDTDENLYNSSRYMTPARIHYHPKWLKPESVNRTHPLPYVNDLSVWAAMYPFYFNIFANTKACVCARGGSGWFHYESSTPKKGELQIIVGFQYIMNFRRKPMPWYKYAVRTTNTLVPCPKTEWGWFHCTTGRWAPLGVESGAAMHRALRGRDWRYDGLIGMNAFNMKLRSQNMVHYFQTVSTHPALDFMYLAYMGRLPYEFLDERYYNTQWGSPVTKQWYFIHWEFDYPEQLQGTALPFN